MRSLRLAFLAAALSSLPLAADPTIVQVPVVLDVHGLNGSHYTSDLTVANVGAAASDVELTLFGTLGPSAGPYLLQVSLLPGRQLYLADVIGTLRNLGAPFPTDGTPIVGTMAVRLAEGDATAPIVGSRVSTPNPDAAVGGSFGTYAMGIPLGAATSGTSVLVGLRENDAFRTNVALVWSSGGGTDPVVLTLRVYDGMTGLAAGDPLDVTLQPGEWRQFTSFLASYGLAQGWVEITQKSGEDRYVAYAVVNDGGAAGGGTSDGSWIGSVSAATSDGTVPIVLSSGAYRTELVLTRPTAITTSLVTVTYTSADALGATPRTGTATFAMPFNTQFILPDALAFLRDKGVTIPASGSQGGTLRVSGALAYARVWSPNPDASVGGTFGVAFPAVPPEARGRTAAFVYGLRQDAAVRSNLAVVNAASSGAPVQFEVDLYDGVTGRQVGSPLVQTLGPGQWFQWGTPLAGLGVTQGYAKVLCRIAGATCDFVAYGVVNDGSSPGRGTSDGSYVPMVRVQ